MINKIKLIKVYLAVITFTYISKISIRVMNIYIKNKVKQ